MRTSKLPDSLERRHFIGGSDARIMGQDEKALAQLWQEKRGEIGPEDLSGNLIVQLGLATEDLNPPRYDHHTGRAGPRSVLAFLASPRPANTQAFSPFVLWQEFDSRCLQGATHLRDCSLRYFATVLLEINNGRQTHKCRLRKLRLSHV